MAINKWAIVTLDVANASKPDRTDHKNTSAFAGADGGNVTVAIDTAVITRLTQLDSALASARALLSSSLTP